MHEKEKGRQTDKQTDKQAGMQVGKQTDRKRQTEMNRQKETDKNEQAEIAFRLTDRYRQKVTETDTEAGWKKKRTKKRQGQEQRHKRIR